MPDLVRIRRALISVSDKSGVEAFARDLVSQGVEIVSTGGTARLLRDAGLPVRTVDSLTNFPEMMDGRVKTLHPNIHGGILAVRDNAEHAAAMQAHSIEPIDLVCVNLYPFEETVAREGCTRDEAIENIDIGGPAMVRSAAKNHEHVAVLSHPRQYGPVLAEMNITDGCVSRELRRQLAAAALRTTADYDDAIATYLSTALETPSQREGAGGGRTSSSGSLREAAGGQSPSPLPLDGAGGGSPPPFPPALTLHFALHQTLRYGENPHQAAAVYTDPSATGPSAITARQLHGKELSYNNLHDASAALELIIALRQHSPAHIAAACIKHANPCGASLASSPLAAVDAAIAGDPLAAFGGIIAVSGTLDLAAANRLCAKDVFLEVLLAEGFEPDVLQALRTRWQNLRILQLAPLDATPEPARTFKPIRGGLLVQDADALAPDPGIWTHAAGPKPTPAQLDAAAAIEIMVRAMNSNAVAIGGLETPSQREGAGGGQTATHVPFEGAGGGQSSRLAPDASRPPAIALFGAGLGQVDRVSACRLAVEKAGPRASAAIAVSDAFFPFADGPKLLIDAGISLIVHTGGSKRDQETFDLCNARGVCCMTTGVRRFRH
ncbi:MAG: bifunctional phosphoribosylaminoimidazolecarboxamide formyltransferase/IMP cyclohydrolase [Phycisphaerales bacterium]